jgi:hypothetical protein
MKRFLSFLALTLLWPIWRAPAWAQLTTLGVGGIAAVVIGTLITPSIVPQVSSYFNANSANGATNNALKPNNGTAGPFELPPAANNSAVIYIEGSIDASLGYNTFETETAISNGSSSAGITVSGNGPGQPAFTVSRNAGGGAPGSQWWNAVSSNLNSSAATQGTGTGYFAGYYPFTATGGNCLREPSGVWQPGQVPHIVDPGFLCGFPPTVDVSLIPGDGAKQNTGTSATPAQAATTCTPNSPIAGEVTITAHLAVAHGIAPGQTYALGGFPSVFATNYTALPGTSGTTLIGEATVNGGSCTTPVAFSGEGTALSGTAGSVTMVPITATNPYGIGETGITTRTAGHFCGIVGEYGSESSFPGAQFASFVDDRGNALPGAPALVPWLNQGTANFTGYTVAGAQSPSSPSLTVTALTPYTFTTWSYSATTGFVTFTMDPTAGLTGFIPGSEFTVTGGGGVAGKTYVVVAQAGVTYPGLTIVANPLSGPVGTPQANNPGASIASGTMASVVMPNMQVLGSTASLTGAVIAPYGQFGATGVGGVGTYALTLTQRARPSRQGLTTGRLGRESRATCKPRAGQRPIRCSSSGAPSAESGSARVRSSRKLSARRLSTSTMPNSSGPLSR